MARGKMEYPMQPVDELPPETSSSRPRYLRLLQQAVEEPKRFFLVARSANANGAGIVKRKIEKGDIEVPPGRWEFHVRKEETNGERRSCLYARYLGEGE